MGKAAAISRALEWRDSGWAETPLKLIGTQRPLSGITTQSGNISTYLVHGSHCHIDSRNEWSQTLQQCWR